MVWNGFASGCDPNQKTCMNRTQGAQIQTKNLGKK